MNSSPFEPAVASICGFSGLNCNDLIAPVCFVVRDMKASSAPFISFSASHKSNDPFSSAPAIIPRGWSAFAGAHAMS
jgi:hypothetical protein